MKKGVDRDQLIRLEDSPVGAKIVSGKDDEFPDGDLFEGVSFCQAVGEAAEGRQLIVGPSSIKVCKWAPVALGFKEAENAFERTITHPLPPVASRIYLAPVSVFDPEKPPDVVIIRTTPDNFRLIIDRLGWDRFIDPGPFGQDVTALQYFRGQPAQGLSGWLIRNVNQWLDLLNRYDCWQRFTSALFRSLIVTRVFDRFIARYMANMSICRNSLAIPFQLKKANISHFCTGGIAWGKNSSRNMTAGLPFEMYRELAPQLLCKGSPC